MTTVIGIASLTRALEEVRKHLDENWDPESFWDAINADQQLLLELYGAYACDLSNFSGIDGDCFDNVDDAKKWLAEKGFELELPNDIPDNAFLALGYNKLITDWMQQGKPTRITANDGADNYPAFTLDSDVNLIEWNNREIVAIEAANDCMVYIEMIDPPKDHFDLLNKINDTMYTFRTTPADGVIEMRRCHATIPMVNIDETPNLDWIKGMLTGDGGWLVDDALQRITIKMDHIGVVAEEATSITMRATAVMPPPMFVVDRPFALWLMEPYATVPTVAAFITPDDWSQPER